MFTRIFCFRGVSYLCFMCPTIMTEPLLPSVQSSAMVPLPVVGSVWSLWCWRASVGPPWAWVESDQAFARDAVALTYRMLPLCCFLRSFMVGRVCSQTRYLPQPSVGAAVGLVCVVIFPFPYSRSHLEWWYPFRVVCTLLFVALLWIGSGKGVLEVTDRRTQGWCT